MTLSREQKFLYTRIGILVLFSFAVGSAFAGGNGFPILYGGFVLCLWGALGLLNYGQHSSVWLLRKKIRLFLLFYGALAGIFFLADTFGLNAHLWFYPHYPGFGLLFVSLILYPFGGLAVLELLYLLASSLGEPLHFREYPTTKWHSVFDVIETVLFLTMIAVVVLGAVKAEWGLALPYVIGLAVFWMLSALVKLRFHINHSGHYLLIIVIATALVALSRWLPSTLAREWIYLETDFLNFLLVGIPSWIWIGWFLFTLVTLRVWTFLVLHLHR